MPNQVSDSSQLPAASDQEKPINTSGSIRSRRLPSRQIVIILGGLVLFIGVTLAGVLIPLVTLPNRTSTTTITTAATVTTDIPCATTCSTQQQCVHGVCVGIGSLSCTLTWSRAANADLLIKTPNNKVIYYGNKGPTNETDGGYLDVDNSNGTGPENIFWSNSTSLPPAGTYYICFSLFSFSFNVSVTNPLTATAQVVYLPSTTLFFTRTFTSSYNIYTYCGSPSPNLVGSFTYP